MHYHFYLKHTLEEKNGGAQAENCIISIIKAISTCAPNEKRMRFWMFTYLCNFA